MKNWTENNNALHKTFTFESFKAALAFMRKAATGIDGLKHHPEWTNIYNKVVVKLTTHDAGNTVTDKDKQLAQLLDDAFDRFNE
ncbi:MAG: 4a-hydroxytetrahydrobiopterin dehydratase [Bacteroidia bacterium]|nr:4a-hydroxytetrahydrobiopterin dehydratase [Bacteroidia bacterium]